MTRFSEALDLKFLSKEGKPEHVFMGSYGIGPGRLMGTIVEVLSDEKGIVWPEAVAPFAIHLVELQSKDVNVKKTAERLYEKLSKTAEVLYDDRDKSAGEKFADSDLIGIPWRIVIGKQGLAEGMFEIVNRKTGEVLKKSREELLALPAA